jgi:hypothetical protein
LLTASDDRARCAHAASRGWRGTRVASRGGVLSTIDLQLLDAVVGGEDAPSPPTTGQQVASYAGACVRGAATGALFGAATGAVFGPGAGAGALAGGIGGCVRGMVMKPTPAY